MDIYNSLIKNTLEIVDKYSKKPLQNDVALWPIESKNIFLMDKDTFVELGGYPNDSVNMLIESSDDFVDGLYVVGDTSLLQSKGHISFGKIVVLKTTDNTNDNIYDFSQKVLLTDTQCYFKDVMTRASSKHYYINYKVSKTAIKNGFSIERMARTIQSEFLKIEEVEKCAVIILIGESGIYKDILPIAEKAKDITVTLNHIFDGINMDCGHCDMSQVCDEVKGLRDIHKKHNK